MVCDVCWGHALHAVLCAALYTRGRGGLARFAGGVGGAGGDALCAITLFAGGFEVPQVTH